MLATLALEETLAPLARQGRRPHARIALCLPEHHADVSEASRVTALGRQVVDALNPIFGRAFETHQISVFPSGHAAGALALSTAARWLESERSEIVVVGGADSAYDWTVLEPIVRENRLQTPDQVEGLIPGEAGAFILLASPRASKQLDLVPRASVLGIGGGTEPYPRPSKQPSSAEGLSAAIEAATRVLHATARRTSFLLSDLTHEPHRIRELQIAIARFGYLLAPDTKLMTPLRELGDIGCASLPLFWVLALEAWFHDYASDTIAVCLGSADGPARGVTVLEEVL
jgi:3-oxoacyl-[acyl-carrier-protein] synthase-1